MKTLLIYQTMGEETLFAIVEGDYSHFHGVMFTGYGDERVKECDRFMYGEGGKLRHNFTSDISVIESKDWDKVAIITFVL